MIIDPSIVFFESWPILRIHQLVLGWPTLRPASNQQQVNGNQPQLHADATGCHLSGGKRKGRHGTNAGPEKPCFMAVLFWSLLWHTGAACVNAVKGFADEFLFGHLIEYFVHTLGLSWGTWIYTQTIRNVRRLGLWVRRFARKMNSTSHKVIRNIGACKVIRHLKMQVLFLVMFVLHFRRVSVVVAHCHSYSLLPSLQSCHFPFNSWLKQGFPGRFSH